MKDKIKLKIALGSDHAGFEYKKEIKDILKKEGYDVIDFGTDSSESCDYPDYVHPVAMFVEREEENVGILICGSGNGVAMTANKHSKIRAALCWNEDLADLAKRHNNANILCIPARFISLDNFKKIVKVFLSSVFEGGRHINRVNKINGEK